MAFYEDIRDEVAVPLIQEFGALVEFMTTSSSNTYTTRFAKIVFASVESKGLQNYGDNGVQLGDWYCLAEVSANPVKGDIIRVGGSGGARYAVVFVEPIQPGGVVLAHKLWARKA